MKRSLFYASLLTLLCVGSSLLWITTTGCASALAALHIVNPTYSIRDIRPHVDIALPLSASSIDFNFILGVDNPNGVGLNLDRVDFNVLVNQNPVVSGTSTQRVQIPSRGVGDVNLQARVGYRQIQSIFQEVVRIVQGNHAQYNLNGNAYYSSPVGDLKFPINVVRTQ